MLKKNNKTVFYCEISSSMVPSGTINQVMSTGAIACFDRVCFTRRRNKNRVIGVKTHIFTMHPLTMHPLDNDNRRQRRQNPHRFAHLRRSGSGRSGRTDGKRAATGRNTYGSVMNINPIFTTGDLL